MEKIIFISAVRDFQMFNKVIENNPFVADDDIILEPIDNTVENIGISKRYNNFLDKFDYSSPSWFVFCHEDWEIKESISNKLEKLAADSLYGTFGARIIEKDGKKAREYVGQIYDCSKTGENLRKVGSRFENLTKVDVLDCQSLVVHSSLIEKHKLRFDENFDWDLYVEDFCLNAKTKFGVDSRVLDIEVCHWSQILNISERPNCKEKYPYINQKYRGHSFAGIVCNIGKEAENIAPGSIEIRSIGSQSRNEVYDYEIASENDARFISIEYIEPDKKILDVGCSRGIFAVALKEKKNARIWGMEYDIASIDVAKGTSIFEEIFQVDLNDFKPEEFQQFYNHFDYIVFGDVLEHIYAPKLILDNFRKYLKNDGYFILSIPNIAHASIKSNLLLDDFTYTPCGLLDETHIKFFTHKSIASFLADIDLEIGECRFTYQDKIGLQPSNPYEFLPAEIQMFIFEDFHSYVLQYVVKAKKTKLPHLKALKINENKLAVSESNAPKDLSNMRKADLDSTQLPTDDLKARLKVKEQEIALMKSSKFWKLRERYLKLKGIKG
jgi:2-polyprenyl-3-methyl-5-hydroxy-6-metoxy-1,4-benzoquinol methylase